MSARPDPFQRGRRDAEQVDAISWPLAAAYLVAFFGSMLAGHLWPMGWWQ